MKKLLTFLSDFGLQDGYVAAVKGAVFSRADGVQIVDITHEIPLGAIDAASYVLQQAAPHFPLGTVHLVVIDPGVGSTRRAIVVDADGHIFVAPDNGVLTGILDTSAEIRAHAITKEELWNPSVSSVFHGRDVFGPVAAYLVNGGSIEEVGEPVRMESLVRSAWPEPRSDGTSWLGQVVYVDRFGNLITNLPLDASVGHQGHVEIQEHRIVLRRTYSEVAPAELVALRGSSGLLEIACNRGNAADILGLGRGAAVVFRMQQRGDPIE